MTDRPPRCSPRCTPPTYRRSGGRASQTSQSRGRSMTECFLSGRWHAARLLEVLGIAQLLNNGPLPVNARTAAAEPAALIWAEVNSADPCTQLKSEQLSDSLHHRAEARCTANSSVAAFAEQPLPRAVRPARSGRAVEGRAAGHIRWALFVCGAASAVLRASRGGPRASPAAYGSRRPPGSSGPGCAAGRCAC